MDFDLSPEITALQETVRRLAQDKIKPRAREIDSTGLAEGALMYATEYVQQRQAFDPHRDIAVLNAAASLVVIGQADDLAAGVALAGQVIDDGRAEQVLAELIPESQSAAADEG